VAPLVSEVSIPEPEIEIDAPAEHDLTSSTAEESLAVSTSDPEISYAIEETPATMDHSLLAESGSPDDESAVIQFETIEPRAIEAAQHLPEVASQPQSTAALVTEDVLDNKENQAEIGTAENIEAEVGFNMLFVNSY
jgi:hypothetical protein